MIPPVCKNLNLSIVNPHPKGSSLPGVDVMSVESRDKTMDNIIDNYLASESKTANGNYKGTNLYKRRKIPRNKYMKHSFANNKSVEDRPHQRINQKIIYGDQRSKQISHSNYAVILYFKL